VLAVACVVPSFLSAQGPKAATYITDEEVKRVNSEPGVDRQIRVVDIGNENFAVGVVHRVATGAGRGTGAGAAGGGGAARGGGAAAGGGAGRGAGGGGAAAGAARGGAGQSAGPCGEQAATPPADGTPGGISHDQQTEGYLIISGSGTLVTGGHIVNGNKSGPDSSVTKELNGPSCSGMIAGADVVKKAVKTGDIIIIPAGVPHGWTNITDHVDYLSFRPSARVLTAGYVHPAIKQ
jgi:mannose-6-phosphate isomerase-like protein (cupin superfamily)